MSKSKHSKLPWKKINEKDFNSAHMPGVGILDADNSEVAGVWEKVDAELIERAVNCHDELVEALDDLANWCQDNIVAECMVGNDGFAASVQHARAILAKAEGRGDHGNHN